MKRPLRFVLVTTFYPPFSFGGDAIHVQSLAGALVRAGHRVDVIHGLERRNPAIQADEAHDAIDDAHH